MPDQPSVLIINRTYPPTRLSTARLTRELARALARDGMKVRVITTDTVGGRDMDGPVTVDRLVATDPPRTLWGTLKLWVRLTVAGLRGPRPDVIITLTDPPLLAVVGDIIARIRGARHIHWVHDVYPDVLPTLGIHLPGSMQDRLHARVRAAMNRAKLVVATGRCMARYLTQTGVDPARVTLIPNWPELAMNPHLAQSPVPFAELDTDMTNAVAGASLMGPIPKFRVMVVGTVGPAHPAGTILDAATILETLHPEIEFIFMGGPESQAIVNAEKARRGLSNVRVLPFQPAVRLREIMESGDIHIISMDEQAAGLMVPAKFYAMVAAARPVILVGPSACEIARVITDYGAGVVIPQGAAQALSQAITDYRLREDIWFAAQEGATRAAGAYAAEDMLRLWSRKVRDVAAAA